MTSARGSYFKKVEPGENDLFFVTVSSKSNLEAAMFGWGARVHQLPRGYGIGCDFIAYASDTIGVIGGSSRSSEARGHGEDGSRHREIRSG